MNHSSNPISTDIDFIKKLIPQKDPFVMVDKLLCFESEQLVSGLTVSADNILTSPEGYFTEAGLIEHMAQSIALHRGYNTYKEVGEDSKPKTGFIGAIKHATIHRLPAVGTALITTVTIVAEVMNVVLVSAEVKDETDTILAASEMKIVVMD